MLLSTLLKLGQNEPLSKFGEAKDVIEWMIPNNDYNRFNKLKKTNPEAFFTFTRLVNIWVDRQYETQVAECEKHHILKREKKFIIPGPSRMNYGI